MAETDTILDNQEVTAQTLNDIAIDLGYTSFNGFGENKFGADELNGITSALVSSGILSSDNKCEPYISDGKVYINTGIIVFANGAKKKITEPVELDLIAGTYIYALNDITHNKCRIVVSGVASDDGDFVNLCEIAADGTLIDKRVISKAKVELPTEGSSYSFTDTITSGNIADYRDKTFTIPITGVTKVFITSFTGSALRTFAQYDILTQKFTGYWFEGSGSELHETVIGGNNIKLYYSGGSSVYSVSVGLVSQNENAVTLQYGIASLGINVSEVEIDYYVFGGI